MIGTSKHGKRIANAMTVMRPCAGVDQHTVGGVAHRRMNALAERTFTVAVEVLELQAGVCSLPVERGADIVKRCRAVVRRITLAEHVEVDALQHENLHGQRRWWTGRVSVTGQRGGRMPLRYSNASLSVDSISVVSSVITDRYMSMVFWNW